MKKILFAFVVGIISSLAVFNPNYAQSPGGVASAASMDHFFNNFNTTTLLKGTLLNTSDVNKKVLKKFKRVYKVNDVKWSDVNGETVANFISDGKFSYVFYDKKCHWEASLKSYPASKINYAIKNRLKNEYPNYKITYVHEIETINNISQPVYVVLIENGKNCKWIRINNGEMDVYKEYDMS